MIHHYEVFAYLHLRTLVVTSEKNFEKLEAWKQLLPDFLNKEEDLAILYGLISVLQIVLIANRLEQM